MTRTLPILWRQWKHTHWSDRSVILKIWNGWFPFQPSYINQDKPSAAKHDQIRASALSSGRNRWTQEAKDLSRRILGQSFNSTISLTTPQLCQFQCERFLRLCFLNLYVQHHATSAQIWCTHVLLLIHIPMFTYPCLFTETFEYPRSEGSRSVISMLTSF